MPRTAASSSSTSGTSASASSAKSPVSAAHRIVVLRGKEAFLREEYTEQFRAALEEAHGGVEVFRFDGETVDRATVLDELRSYGLMQSFKLVVLDHADLFLARGEDGEFRRAMERYAQSPVDHAALLMRADTWRKGKIDKLIEQCGALLKCDEVRPASAAAWCVKRAKKAHDFSLAPDAAAMLVERLGASLTHLDSELAKLGANAEAGGTVGVDLVREVIGLSREEMGWVIQDAVLSGSSKRALEKLHELREISLVAEEPLMWSLIEACRKLHHAARLAQQRVPGGVIAKELRLWGDARDRILAASRRHPPSVYAQLLRSAIRADQRRKTGTAGSTSTLECLAVRIADTVR